MNPVIVHGGGPSITSYMERLGMEVEFVEGLRVSDEQTVELAKMVLVGKENKDIVLRINRAGQPAVGLCGDDGLLFTVRKRELASGADIGFVGDIERVDVDVLNHIAEDYIPVIASVGADVEGQLVQRQRRRGGGRGRRGARRLQGRLPDRRRGLARRRRQADLVRAPGRRARARSTRSSGGMRPEARGVPARGRRAA